jgi:hypothetical protein
MARKQLRNVCKHAARECMQNVGSVSYLEDETIAFYADKAYVNADYDKQDEETFLKVWTTAYKSAQAMLISTRSRFASGTIKANKRQTVMELEVNEDCDYEASQMLESVIWSIDFEGGFDVAYDKWLAEKVESAAIPQESEVAV